MTPVIRLAQLRDIHSLVDIDLKGYVYPWSIDKWREIAADSTCIILLASFKVEPIGVCVWQKKPATKEGEILRLAVKPSHRCQGIGTLLLHNVETEAKENNLQEMVIVVPEINCFPGHPDDVSKWLLEQGYQAVTPILKNHFHMYGSYCDGFKFINSLVGEDND